MKQGQFVARSKHSGDVTVALCDGSDRFVADTVDMVGVWRPLPSARGGRAGAASPGNDW